MRFSSSLILSVALIGCSPAPQSAPASVADEYIEDGASASFSVRNDEIREDMIRMLDKEGIDYSLGAAGEIIYFLADGEAIDRIGNEAISEYITRN